MNGSTIRQQFNQLSADRADLESRVEEYAQWTLPYLSPINNDTMYELKNDWQSIGARAVNHLSNKLMVALFSPTRPFFRIDVSDKMAAALEAKGLTEADQLSATSAAERQAFKALGPLGLRTTLALAMKYLIVTGNCLILVDKDDESSQVYNLRDYVIVRDLSGKVIKIITRDRKDITTIPKEYNKYIPEDKAAQHSFGTCKQVDLYTYIELQQDGTYDVVQSIEDNMVEETKTTYKANDLPWIAASWTLPRGWHYGVGMVEEYAGDFHAMSVIVESMDKATAIMCDIKGLVNPAGVTDVDEWNKADTGEMVNGQDGDIVYPALGNKVVDLQYVMNVVQWYEKRVGEAFLLNSAVTRDAERVTAEEIRMQANELNTSLGGQYSTLAEDIQLPLSYLLLADVEFDLIDGFVPIVTTGIDSLSRQSDLDATIQFVTIMAQMATIPTEVLQKLDIAAIAAKVGSGLGIDHTELINTDEQEVQQQNQNVANAGAEAEAVAKGQAQGQAVVPQQ